MRPQVKKRPNKIRAQLALAYLSFGLVLTLMLWNLTAAVRGSIIARLDVARGSYRILAYGFPMFESQEYEQVLGKRYGIDYRQVALCIVSETTPTYADSYNSVSLPAIKSKFGSRALFDARTEAKIEFLRTHPEFRDSASFKNR